MQPDTDFDEISDPSLNGSPKVVIGGMTLHRLSAQAWEDQFIADCAKNSSRNLLARMTTSANGHVLSRYARELDFRNLIDQFDAIDFDGMPLVFASRLFTKTPAPERVHTDMMIPRIARRAACEGRRIFLLGSTEEVNHKARNALVQSIPNLQISGRNGFFSPEDLPQIAKEILDFGTDALFIGMGVPLEHKIAIQIKPMLRGVSLIKTAGGAMDVISGEKHIPSWMSSIALGWLHRFITEPTSRKRYIVTNPHAAWLLLTASGSIKNE